ncbi:hypothetical protein ACIO6U_02630 [Streptomyces sp. NPDC087422]|uniref:hypothetical protein n=1 Tax=Streptomyces sp. NPDC087422 TaxID=3365786 RepID=UPI0037F50DA7
MAQEQVNLNAVAGSRWVRAFTFYSEGVLTDLTGLPWEFAIQKSVTDKGDPIVSVSTTVGPQGSIEVDLPTSTLTITLTASATALLGKSAYAHALWANADDEDARTAWITGVFNTSLAAAP